MSGFAPTLRSRPAPGNQTIKYGDYWNRDPRRAGSLTATEVARRFADVLNRVAYRRESFAVVRGKRPLAELRPLPVGTRLADVPAILAALPRLEPSEADVFAADLDAALIELAPLEITDPWAS